VLGRAVFRGLRDPSVLQFPVDIDRGAILAYNALHLTVAMAIGFVVAVLIVFGEQNAPQRRLVRFMIGAGYVVTVAMVGLLTAPMRDLLPWWSIIVANAMAVVWAGAYLLAKHPGLWQRIALVEP
jgi:protein-S-isoprenylcysteine O-methyltransferase Ste14